jgi:hypothetical protein
MRSGVAWLDKPGPDFSLVREGHVPPAQVAIRQSILSVSRLMDRSSKALIRLLTNVDKPQNEYEPLLVFFFFFKAV